MKVRRRRSIARCATYLDHLTVERGLSANTLLSYRRDLRRYQEFLLRPRAYGPGEVSEADVDRLRPHLRTGDDEHPALSGSSAGRTVVAVRGFHRFCLREGIAATTRRAPYARRRHHGGCPRRSRWRRSRRCSRRRGSARPPRSLRDRALLEVLYGAGARISEAVGLDVDDVDLERGAVLLRGKGCKERLVPLGSYARAAVSDYLVRARPELAAQGRGTPALFLNARGGRLTRQSAWVVLRAAAGAGRRRAPSTSRRTPCGTPSRPTCSTAGPTSGSSRSCWGTPR